MSRTVRSFAKVSRPGRAAALEGQGEFIRKMVISACSPLQGYPILVVAGQFTCEMPVAIGTTKHNRARPIPADFPQGMKQSR